jgi:hypothetical protein
MFRNDDDEMAKEIELIFHENDRLNEFNQNQWVISQKLTYKTME